METFSERRLEDALRALRPVPAERFAAELDLQAAAGFAGEGPHEAAAAVLDRLRLAPRRRLRGALAGAAVAAIAIATTAVTVSERGDTGTVENSAVPTPKAGRAASGAAAAPERSSEIEFSERVPLAGSSGTAATSQPAIPSELNPPAKRSGPFTAQARHRQVERAAEVVVGADPQDVHEVAGQVLAVVHRYEGVVLRSTVNVVGGAPSSFDLLIPSASLGDALAEISSAAPVLSRRESALDVTGPAIGLDERLRDIRARVASLLGELASAESEAAREAVEAKLGFARRQESALRSRLSSLQRRVHFSRVSVQIRPDAAAGGGSGAWGLSDGVSAAGRVLATAAAVTLIGLAALALPAAIALTAWLARRTWLRRAREQALG